jgi:hypothetical protein
VPVSSVAATGAIAAPFEKMARLLSTCPTFQTAMGAGSSDAAFDLIDYPYWRQNNSDTPAGQDFETQPVPGCTIARVDDLNMMWSIYKNDLFAGDLLVEFRVAVSGSHGGNSKDRLVEFMNTIGAIIKEAYARSNVTDGDNVHALEVNEPVREIVTPQETNADEESTPGGAPFLIAAYMFEVVA